MRGTGDPKGDGETAIVEILVEPQEEGTIQNFAQVFLAGNFANPIDTVTGTTTVIGNNSPNHPRDPFDSDNDGTIPPVWNRRSHN